jgi:ABC-type taurine transport system substrate-binding protein
VEVSAGAFKRIFERVDFSLQFSEEILAAVEDTAQFLFDQGKIDTIPEFRWDGSFLEEAIALRASQ